MIQFSKRVRSSLANGLVVGLAVIFPGALAAAQIVRGKVVEFRSDLAVDRAQVSLLDAQKNEMGIEARTDSLGRFTIKAPQAGRYIVRSRRIGYEEFFSIPRDVRVGDTVSVNLWPEANGQLLDSILTVDQRAARAKALARASRSGFGQFIDRATIAKEEYRDVEDAIVRGVPGSEVVRRVGQVAALCYRTCCSFSVFRNGLSTSTPSNPRGTLVQLQIALATRGNNAYGVELYVGRGEIPLEYRDGAGGSCGVLAYWTRPRDGSF